MSHPFIIWTMQRTGGTTLASLLMDMSEHPALPHEPLNRGRLMGWISDAWVVSEDAQALGDSLRQGLAEQPLLKHCFELVPEAVNEALLDVATGLGYRHLVLDRGSEVDRIVSLALAEVTGVWGKQGSFAVYGDIEAGTVALPEIDIAAALAHLRACHRRRQEVRSLFESRGAAPFVVFFEELYADAAAGAQKVRRMVEFLGLSPATMPDYDTRVAQALTQSGQNSSRVIDRIPNITELRSALEEETAARPFPWLRRPPPFSEDSD